MHSYPDPAVGRAATAYQRIFLVRHGETDPNAQGIVQGGGIDADLNANGHEQAEQLYQAYGRETFVAVVGSGLRRTHQTLAPFVRAGHALVTHPGLNEMSWGVLEGAATDERVRAYYRDINDRWAAGELDARIEGGESPLEVAQRAQAALRELLLQYPTGDLFIVSHGRLLRILLAELLGYGLQRMHWFGHKNTGVNLLLRARDRFVALKLNDTLHLN